MANTRQDTLFFGGPDVEPKNSRSWKRARKAGRRRYYEILAKHLDREHEAQVIEGRDRHNRYMRKLKNPRKPPYDGAPGKPLNPWRELSKVNANRRWSITDKGCRMFWVGTRNGGKISVQRVLFAHARRDGEFVRGAPVRDVLGIAKSRVKRAVKAARAEWTKIHPQDRIPEPAPQPAIAAQGGAEIVDGYDISGLPEEVKEIIRKYPFMAKRYFPTWAQRGPNGEPPLTYRTPPPTATVAPPSLEGGLQGALQRIRERQQPMQPQRRIAAELPTYGPSQAVIVDYNDGLDREIARSLGRPITARQAASIAGAPDDARVGISTIYEEVTITWTRGDGTLGVRLIRRNADGSLRLVNERFEVPQSQQGKGLGRQVFGRQVEQARELGITRIVTKAAGDADHPSLTGYKVWPKFGYDGPLPPEILEILPESLQGATKISDLMLTREGRNWWEANGKTINLIFDLSEGSQSLQVWEAYLREKMKSRNRKQG